jgi:uncharacterized protein (TIRG00374 family)
MHRWRLWVGFAVSAAFLGLAVVGIDWREVWNAFHQADWRWLLLAAGLLVAYLLARSVRWRILLGPAVPLAESFAMTNIGYLVSNVLPLRLGDPARAVAIGLKGHVRVSTALGTVVVERVLDMVIVVLLLMLTLPFVGETGWTSAAGLAGGVLGVAALAILAFVAVWPERGRHTVQKLLALVPWIDQDRWIDRASGLIDGLAALRSPRRVAGLAGWSILTWVCSVGIYFGVLAAFIEEPTVVKAAFLTSAVGLGMALPSSPGAMGVFHTVARYALELPFGVAREPALAIAFMSHALIYVIMCLLGLVGLLQQNLSLRTLQSGIRTTLAQE